MQKNTHIKKRRGIRSEDVFENRNIMIFTDMGIIHGLCVLYGKEEIHLLNVHADVNGRTYKTRYGLVRKKDAKIILVDDSIRM